MKPRTLLWLFAIAVIVFVVWLLKPTTPYTPPTTDPPYKEKLVRKEYPPIPDGTQSWPDDPKNK